MDLLLVLFYYYTDNETSSRVVDVWVTGISVFPDSRSCSGSRSVRINEFTYWVYDRLLLIPVTYRQQSV